MNDSRQIAITILQKILNEGMFFSEAKELLQIDKHKDIAFINILVLTTLRRRIFIQQALHQFIKKPHKGAPRFTDLAIETAVAEILFLDTPDYAVLNSYVNIIKQQSDKYIANFANAILRNITSQKTEILQQNTSILFSDKFKTQILKDYSSIKIQELEQCSMIIPPLDLTIKNHSQLQDINQHLQGIILPNGTIRLQHSGKINELYGYNQGLWWIQDFAASLPVLALGDIKDKNVLDLCAAPGGKTAQLISRGAKTTALDISHSRLNTLQENLQRLNLQADNIVCDNAVTFLQNYNGTLFDIILLDAPCSASGTFRRHPELIHTKNQKDIDKSVEIQKRLLELSSQALKKEGILLYTVCSITIQEGEAQIANFLQKHPEYKLIPILESDLTTQNKNDFPNIINSNGCIRTFPFHLKEQGGMDSFFVAKLQKVQ